MSRRQRRCDKGSAPTGKFDRSMNWDLTSYFPQFDGAEMRRVKEALRRDIASLKDRAASLLPLNDENASGWEDVLTQNEALTRRMSHLSSYMSCLAASDGR